jgi:tungstate transport system substrate-binding protein
MKFDRHSMAARATRRACLLLAAAAVVAGSMATQAQDRNIIVASTTSTQDSGLFGHILPLFKKKSGIDVRVISQGTGQALDTGRRGDADVVFVHAKPQEEKFVADGNGVKRFAVMYNDFVLVGPKSDPAKIGGTKDIVAALKTIKDRQAAFISRGDKSGTHAAELSLWKAAGIDIVKDRGTWLSFKNRGPLVISVEGDQRLFNQYGVMLVNPARHKHIKAKDGQAFIDWLISPEGQKAIAEYKIGGQQLFFPNSMQPGA